MKAKRHILNREEKTNSVADQPEAHGNRKRHLAPKERTCDKNYKSQKARNRTNNRWQDVSLCCGHPSIKTSLYSERKCVGKETPDHDDTPCEALACKTWGEKNYNRPPPNSQQETDETTECNNHQVDASHEIPTAFRFFAQRADQRRQNSVFQRPRHGPHEETDEPERHVVCVHRRRSAEKPRDHDGSDVANRLCGERDSRDKKRGVPRRTDGGEAIQHSAERPPHYERAPACETELLSRLFFECGKPCSFMSNILTRFAISVKVGASRRIEDVTTPPSPSFEAPSKKSEIVKKASIPNYYVHFGGHDVCAMPTILKKSVASRTRALGSYVNRPSFGIQYLPCANQFLYLSAPFKSPINCLASGSN